MIAQPESESPALPSRLPRHIGIIPDGNRRWAERSGLGRHAGYDSGVEPGLRLYRACREAGIEELSVFGFTRDNAKRPSAQVEAFRSACAEVGRRLAEAGAEVRAVGDEASPLFPDGLRGLIGGRGKSPRVNLLVNYGWRWDLDGIRFGPHRTAGIPPIELVIRWGGGRRLSGFLPVQSAYADFFVVDALWPDYQDSHLFEALSWYSTQDRMP
ncbi:MAG: undecaprenyl diphosphate synthase family protein [Elusimicrobia bacterium]|nr:undecaprenyl diphosphate synthase family protein [Elusimicrobiota bacterium]